MEIHHFFRLDLFQRVSAIFSFSLCLSAVTLFAASESEIQEWVESAYDFDHEAMSRLLDEENGIEEPLQSFLTASTAYWQFQSDRIEETKSDNALDRLSDAIDVSKEYHKADKENPDFQFYLGLSYCNRARFYVEVQSWMKAYLDARKGLSMLEELVEDHPDYVDAYFALGVAESFLSDAPVLLKPLAMLLGFSGSKEEGIQKLERCVAEGKWTSVEASYYLGYFYYKVERNGAQTIAALEPIVERYPRNPLFSYFLGRGHQINHDPLKALEVYQAIQPICYEVGAEDFGNWTSYRIGNILHGEQQYEEALEYYIDLKKRLVVENQEQEYFYRLPLKVARTLHELKMDQQAIAYIEVIDSRWDGETYRMAKDLKASIEASK